MSFKLEISFEFPRCLNPSEQAMHGTAFEHFAQRYIIPVFAISGIIGNLLNLCVLLRSRRRSHILLAVLALADIGFLILQLPNVFINYSAFVLNYDFRYFYFLTRIHSLSLTNWCSAVAIWSVIAVCADRLLGIRRPLYVRDDWAAWKMPAIIVMILGATRLLTAYQHFEYACVAGRFCNGTQLYQICRRVIEETWFKNQTNPYSMEFRGFIKASVYLHAITLIFLPIVLLSVLNIMLILSLRQRRRNLSFESMKCQQVKLSVSSQNAVTLSRTEQCVTFTVARIVTTFTLANAPSAIVSLFRTAHHKPDRYEYDLTMICNVLIIAGKASNFVLFCLSSQHFRKQLSEALSKRIYRLPGIPLKT